MKPEYLFVYGTLRWGIEGAMARKLHNQVSRIGPGRLTGILYDLGQYPGLYMGPEANQPVLGDVFYLPDAQAVFSWLDAYEGQSDPPTPDDEYQRVLVEVMVGQQSVLAWTYLLQEVNDHYRTIASGDYLEYIRDRPAHQAFLHQ